MKLVDYPEIETLSSDNVLVVDGAEGTQTISANNLKLFMLSQITPQYFVLKSEDWVASETYPEYLFQNSINIPGLNPNDLVRADFNLASLTIANEFEVAGAGDTAEDSIIFFAKTQPDVDLTGAMIIFKALEE